MDTLAVLEERTKNIVKKIDDHVEEDGQNFREVFQAIKKIEIAQARSGVIIGIIVVCAQIVIGAWVKGVLW